MLPTQLAFAQSGDWEQVHQANYVEIDDLERLERLGINTVLVELEKRPESWPKVFDAVAKHNMRLVPVLWGKHQSIWKWNKREAEWELDLNRYPKSTGAKFLDLLRTQPKYLRHTFAIYSFHEPWYLPDTGKRKGTVQPDRQRKFWQQIRKMFDGKLKVYGEEVSWVPECKNGCVDYDYVTLYSFARSGDRFGYSPGGRFLVGKSGIDGSQADFQLDPQAAIEQEVDQIKLMHDAIQAAPAAPDGSRTKLIALIGTFAHDEEPEKWNRMPSANEMQQWANEVVRPNRSRLAGLGWYAFRNPTDYYKHVLVNSRFDEANQDRWTVIGKVSTELFGNQKTE